MRLINWVSSWATTLRIKFFERETYRQLIIDFDPDDYEEVE